MADSKYNFIVENEDIIVKFSCSNHVKRISETIKNLLDDKEEDDDAIQSRFVGKGDIRFSFDGEASESISLKHQAVFFENTDYPLLVKCKHGNVKDITMYIADHRITDTSNKGRILSDGNELYGTLNFKNQVGETSFKFTYKQVKDDVEKEMAFETEVLSYKLNYRTDLRNIIADVENEYAMLSYSFMKDTYQSLKSGNGKSTELIWWQIFKSVHKEILEYASIIIDRPKRRLKSVPKYERAERLGTLPRELENEYIIHKEDPSYLYRTEELVLSHDTIENRFLKYALKEMQNRFVVVKQHILKVMKLSSEEELSSEINHIEEDLTRVNNHSFFRGIGQFKGFSQDSLVMKQAYGYKEILQKWIELQCGYEIEEESRKLETKEISELYEIWCFIKVKNIVEKILEGKATAKKDGLAVKGDFILKLIQGQQSEIEFDNSEGVTLAAVCYNAEVEKEKQKSRSAIKGTDSLTTIQRPDIVLRLSKEGDDIKYTYLFDAKYRIDDSKIGDMDVPPEDAIDQLHRYRDAIYFTGEEILKKEIVAGYILFPGKVSKEALDPNVSEDKKYYYQKSNEKIGIGAFPLRPTQKSIIDEDGNLVLDANDSEEALERQIRQWIEEENPREKLLEECVPQKGLTYEYEDVIANYLIIDVLSDVGNDIDAFKNGEAKKYFFGKRGPAEDVDLSSIKYLVPVMERNVAGYYRIKSMKFNFEEVRFEVELENYKSLNSSISYNDSNARGIMKSAEEFKSMIEESV